jgi:hypothetical protein
MVKLDNGPCHVSGIPLQKLRGKIPFAKAKGKNPFCKGENPRCLTKKNGGKIHGPTSGICTAKFLQSVDGKRKQQQ